MCLLSACQPFLVITSVLLFKSISYYVIRQMSFCIYKHLHVLISFFLLNYSSSFLLYTGGCDICGNNPRVAFAVWTKKCNFGS